MPRKFGRSRDDALQDALDAADKIMAWSDGKTLTDYKADEYLRSAIERKVEIFSEALRLADEQDSTLRNSIPSIGDIFGMRNAIAHGYFNVSNDIVWSAATVFLPSVRERLRELLGHDLAPSPDGA